MRIVAMFAFALLPLAGCGLQAQESKEGEKKAEDKKVEQPAKEEPKPAPKAEPVVYTIGMDNAT